MEEKWLGIFGLPNSTIVGISMNKNHMHIHTCKKKGYVIIKVMVHCNLGYTEA